MMKLVTSIILCLVVSSLWASNEGERKALPEIQVISDKYDENVPDGKCKVTGTVYFHGEPQVGAEVCSYEGKQCVKTDKKGQFSLLIDIAENYVYASMIGAKANYLSNHDFKSKHHLVLQFNMMDYAPEVLKKPVIYVYADEATDLELKLNTEAELSFTYPAYQDGWRVQVDPSKGLSVEGKNYPYLFWEGLNHGNLQYAIVDQQLVGEVIHTDTIISYLEDQLQTYGLNAKETTDFITFWGPVLRQQSYVFVQFVVDSGYDRIASLESSVLLDNERRVFMQYESFDERPNLNVTHTQPPAESIDRNGLTLIEWGGAEVALPEL